MTAIRAARTVIEEPATPREREVVSSTQDQSRVVAHWPFQFAARRPEQELTPSIRGSASADIGIDSDAERRIAWQRRVASMLAGDLKLPLALLSFIAAHGSVQVDALTAQGEPRAIFEAVFDLYDAELLSRVGATISISDSGRFLLRRAGLE